MNWSLDLGSVKRGSDVFSIYMPSYPIQFHFLFQSCDFTFEQRLKASRLSKAKSERLYKNGQCFPRTFRERNFCRCIQRPSAQMFHKLKRGIQGELKISLSECFHISILKMFQVLLLLSMTYRSLRVGLGQLVKIVLCFENVVCILKLGTRLSCVSSYILNI